MTKLCTCLLFFTVGVLFAQPATEVYVMEITPVEKDFKISEITITNFTNMSNNDAYDSQPSFYDNSTIVYAGTKTDNTEIIISSVHSKKKTSYFEPTEGGEYSPQLIPNSNRIAAVRLDKDGKQRLYDYTPGKNIVTEVIEGLQVAYYAYHDAETILASVLSGGNLDLVIANVKTQKVDTLLGKSGRSIHRIPSKKEMSYTLTNEEGNFDIYQIDMETRESFFVTQLPIGIQDHIWMDDSKLLCGSGAKLYLYDLFGKGAWEEVADLSAYDIIDITRLALSPDGKRLALVAEPKFDTPSTIVAKHIPPFNARDLDAYMDCFTEDVWVGNFPRKEQSTGIAALRDGYAKYYEKYAQTNVQVINEMAVGNYVVYEEEGTRDGQKNRHATVFDVANGKIASMTFIHDFKSKEDPEAIVQKQLDAYNNRDIDGFMATYAEDVKLYSFPDKLNSEGQETMRKGYDGYFKNTPDLHCEIKKRVVIGNKVIDHEYITSNGRNFSAIAIYEVKNGLISKVTFIQ